MHNSQKIDGKYIFSKIYKKIFSTNWQFTTTERRAKAKDSRMQNAECKMQNAKCKMQNAECRISFQLSTFN